MRRRFSAVLLLIILFPIILLLCAEKMRTRIIRFREESDWPLIWTALFVLSQDSWLPATDYPRASRSFPRIAGSGNEIEGQQRTFKQHKKRKYCYFPSSNLIHITTLNHAYKVNKEMILPCFFLLNSRSLLPKLDELTALLSFKPIDIIAITESWLHEHIDSSLLSINDYNLFPKDRAIGRGGGVCAYIKKDIPCIRRVDLESENLECLWLSLDLFLVSLFVSCITHLV